eukprot:3134638-Rhodomonas_salina.1
MLRHGCENTPSSKQAYHQIQPTLRTRAVAETPSRRIPETGAARPKAPVPSHNSTPLVED